MQVNVKYEYTELYLPTPRCRKYRSRDAKKSCETEVKEVKASELVPAFTVDEYVCPIYEKRHIYAFDGALWELDRYSEHHARKSWYDLTPCNEDYIAYLLTPDRWEIHEFRTETEKIEEVIHNKSKNYLICNGKLYRKTTEPMYGIFTFGLGHNHASTALFIEMYYNANYGHYRIVTDWEPSDDDCEDAIFGAATPEKLVHFAQGMKNDCREMATALLKKSSIYGYPFNKESIEYVEMDSVESRIMRSAFEMMDNTFNFESSIAMITDSDIKVFPDSDDIEKIVKNPANWVVVPLLFKECDY